MGASDRGTGFLILIWVLTAVSFIIVSLRVFAKLRIKQFRLDDVLMTTALISGMIAAILNTIGVNYGYEAGSEANPVSSSATLARKFAIIAQAIIVICATLGRAAFIVYLLAILGDQKWQRVTLTTLVIMEIIINVLIVVLLCASCRPIAFLWDFTLDGSCLAPGVLINYGYFSSAFDIFTDLYLAVVPTYIFWHLQLKLAVKLTLIGLMSCGLVAMGAALAKALQLHEISDTFSTGTADLLRWSYIEANLVMITSSVPCLRSLVLSGFHYMNSSGHRSRSYELGAALTGTRRGTTSVTAHNNSQHQRVDSRVRNILSSRNNGDDGASAHYILESRNSIDAVKSSESSSQDLRTGQFGIQKQVDVTITSHAHSPDDGDSFK